jgi:hypothetical protein
MSRSESRRFRWAMVFVAWSAAVAIGIALLWRYAATAGEAAAPPEQWPAQSVIKRESGHPTLVMLAHPRCPCTRASVAELAVLMTRLGPMARAHVLFVRPRAVEAGWQETPLWQSAAAIPGVTVHADPGGVEAARFRASTSGQLVVYDASGALAFSGGITGARGHEGDNVGLSRALARLTGGQPDQNGSKVFGCALGSRATAKGALEL